VQDSYGRQWRRSTRCASSDCVEIALGMHEVFVRDSKDRYGATLVFSTASWLDFIEGVKADAIGGEA
jgi:hypothetical protein